MLLHTYTLPDAQDANGETVTVAVDLAEADGIIQYDAATATFVVYSSAVSDLPFSSEFRIYIELENQSGDTAAYELTVLVVQAGTYYANTAPYFSAPLHNLFVYYPNAEVEEGDEIAEFEFPVIIDDQGDDVSLFFDWGEIEDFVLFDQDEMLYDWQGMTLEQILSAMEMPGVIVFWGRWNEVELQTVFYDYTCQK